MITIQQIQYIISLAEEKHFVRASDRCNVTQPTLSMQIKKAENQLGVELFQRKKVVELTSAGKFLIETLYQVQNSYLKIEEMVHRHKNGFFKELSVGIIPTISNYLIPDFYSIWKDKLNSVNIRFVEGYTHELLQQLENGTQDCVIVAGDFQRRNFRESFLYNEELLLYASNLLKSKKELQLKDLDGMQPWLMTDGNCLKNQMMNFCLIENSAQWEYQGDSMEILKRMVDKNGGYTLLPQFSINQNEKARRIASEDNYFPARKVVALTNKSTAKWEFVKQIIFTIQQKYIATKDGSKYVFLDWK